MYGNALCITEDSEVLLNRSPGERNILAFKKASPSLEDQTPLQCAVCSAPTKSTVITIPSLSCPSDDEWDLEYGGSLVAASNVRSDHVCIARGVGIHSDVDCSVCTYPKLITSIA